MADRTSPGAPTLGFMPTSAQQSYAICRVMGHEWAHIPGALGGEHGTYGLRSHCSHCGTKRTKWITRSGAVARGQYEYPKDYASRGDERLESTQWRRLLITTLEPEPAKRARKSAA